jgi:hypothetical protein
LGFGFVWFLPLSALRLSKLTAILRLYSHSQMLPLFFPGIEITAFP